jgi:hypothetical protein
MTGKIPSSDKITSINIKNTEMKERFFYSFNAFNKYFLPVAENLSSIVRHNNDSYNKFMSINLVLRTPKEISDISNLSKVKNSFGYDDISSKVIKMCYILISEPVSHMCNHALATGLSQID